MRTSRTAAATLTAALLLLTAACGGEDSAQPAEPAQDPPAAQQAAAADPKRDWTSAVAGLCTDLAGVVAGRQISDFADDNKYTPDEIVAADAAARAAAKAFDDGYAALPAPPEAAEAKKAFDAFLAASRPHVAALLAAAKAGDETTMTKAFSGLEGVRLGPTGVKSFTAQGLPEKCHYRGSYT